MGGSLVGACVELEGDRDGDWVGGRVGFCVGADVGDFVFAGKVYRGVGTIVSFNARTGELTPPAITLRASEK